MKTKLLLFSAFCLGFVISLSAQVGVGTTNPQSTLDIEASDSTSPTNADGILIPRIDNFPASNPTVAQDGMLVFYTGTARSGKGFYYWNQTITDWVFLAAGAKNTLDQAYDEGGAGAGRTITADSGAVIIDGGDGLRVESSSESHMLHVHGANNAVGIGKNNPQSPLHIGIATPFDLIGNNTGQDGIFINGGNDFSGTDAIGGSIAFGGATSTRENARKSAIALVQTTNDEDQTGLAFYVHPTIANSSPMEEAMRLTHQKYLGINNLAPSATLDVVGTMQFVDGNQAAGYVLSSDANGNASWTDPNTIFTDTNSTYNGTDFALSNQSLGAGQYVTGIDAFGNLIAGTDQDSQTLNLVGSTLSISNGNSVNLSSLTDNDWTTVGANIERQSGNVYIGDTAGTDNDLYISNSIIDWDNSSYVLDPGGDNRMNEIELDNGTVADPSLYFEGDPDFGFNYDALNNEIFLTDNGSVALTLRKDGGIEPSNGIKIGNNAAPSNTSGQNIFLGIQSGFSNTSGASNIGIGYFSLRSTITNGSNIAIGSSALRNYVGNAVPGNNLAVGHNSMGNLTDGTLNTALGIGAMQNINFNTSNNVAVGTYALRNLASGSGNTVLGSSAGNLASGSSNVFLGYASGFNSSGSRNVFIGYTAGYNAPAGNDMLYIENTNSNTPLIYGEFLSDMVRINGELQVGIPTGTGYAFPTTDGAPGEVLTTDGAGTVSWSSASSSPSIARATMSGNQVISGVGNHLIVFDVETFDLQGDYDHTSYRYIVPATGIYRVNGNLIATTSGILRFAVFINGTEYLAHLGGVSPRNIDTSSIKHQ